MMEIRQIKSVVFLVLSVFTPRCIEGLGLSALSVERNCEKTTPRTMTANECCESGGHSVPFRLGYVTDVEGNLDYLLRFVEQSNVLDVQKQTLKSLSLALRDNCYFVYGGDAVDKGPGDIRIVRALVDLKRRYPERVFLLVGNRDLNKLRLVAELSAADMERPISEIPPPHWDPKAPTLRQFLEEKIRATGLTLEESNTRVNRLHYMLEHTLGCPKTFFFRRDELSILSSRSKDEITDEEIIQSFLYEVEKGSLRHYMEVANVAVCIGNSLFCHGAVDKATMQFVPSISTKFENPLSKPTAFATIDNVQEWTGALNELLKKSLEDFFDRPLWNDSRTSRGGEALMALQNRPAMWGRSIISNCYGDGGCITTENAARIRNDPQRLDMEKTNPLAFEKVSSDPRDPSVADWLKKDGIQRVIVGHKPTGDCPAVLSASYTGVEVVSADTSFSDTSADDNRGNALALVEIAGNSDIDNHLELFGSLCTGSTYTSLYSRLHSSGIDNSTGDKNLGTEFAAGGWWVKAIVGNSYLLTRGSGRKVEQKTVSIVDSLEKLPWLQ